MFDRVRTTAASEPDAISPTSHSMSLHKPSAAQDDGEVAQRQVVEALAAFEERDDTTAAQFLGESDEFPGRRGSIS